MSTSKPAQTERAPHVTGEEAPISAILRQHAEQQYAEELAELARADNRQRPPNWSLSPWAVRTYLLGGKLDSGFVVSPKYIGNARLIEIAVATLATDRALLLYGIPGTAKCIKHDTLVLDTRTGKRMTIAEACRKRDIELASLQSDYRLQQQAPTDYINNGVRPCYRVTTYLGREIEVTINHPFLTIDGWQPLANLSPGDRIAVPRALPFFGNAKLSDARVKILAHLIAEGCLSQGLPYYSNTNPDMQRDFSEAVQRAFPGLQAHWYPDGKNCSVSGGYRGNTFRNPCTQWLRSLGIMGTTSGNKFVPNVVFSLPKRQIALFLNRLFSGDGFLHLRSTTKQITIDYSSKSKRLIQDVQHLLLRFGINARFRQSNTGHYRLFIHGTESCRIFLQEIGLLGRKYVEEALAHLNTVDNKLTNPNLDTIPHQVWRRLEQAAINTGYTSIATLVRTDRKALYNTSKKTSRAAIIRGQSIPRPRLSRLALLANNDDLQQLAQSDIYWDTIASIEPIGEHQVYDLSMAETHNFVVE
jgi:replicative DNA helicase